MFHSLWLGFVCVCVFVCAHMRVCRERKLDGDNMACILIRAVRGPKHQLVTLSPPDLCAVHYVMEWAN